LIAPRGEMENRIKECQLDLNADRTSTARYEQTSTPKFGRRRRRGRRSHRAARNGMKARNTPTLVQSTSPANTPETKLTIGHRGEEAQAGNSHQTFANPSTIPSSSTRAARRKTRASKKRWRNGQGGASRNCKRSEQRARHGTSQNVDDEREGSRNQSIVADACPPAVVNHMCPLAKQPSVKWRRCRPIIRRGICGPGLPRWRESSGLEDQIPRSLARTFSVTQVEWCATGLSSPGIMPDGVSPHPKR
jgi:hypothetical protein